MSQAQLVADLESVTGWRLLRENYSKYETGAMTPEPDTLARFIAYHAHYGRPGPDFTPASDPDPAPDMATALDRLARAGQAIATEMAEWRREREEMREQIDQLRATVRSLVEAGPLAEGTRAPAAPSAPLG